MDDQRQEHRTHLIYYLRIFDRQSRALFGHVVDISPRGMLITSDKPMSTTTQYQLALEDISALDRLATLDVDAECRWCQEDSPGGLYDAGFRLIAPSRQVHALLTAYQ